MIIIDNSQSVIFGELKKGDTFTHKGEFFMVIDEIIDRSAVTNCVNLRTGDTDIFCSGCLVEKVNCVLQIKS